MSQSILDENQTKSATKWHAYHSSVAVKMLYNDANTCCSHSY